MKTNETRLFQKPENVIHRAVEGMGLPQRNKVVIQP